MPTGVPEEVYDEVYRLAMLITESVAEADEEAEEFYYEQIRSYCLNEIDSGRELAFLWETLGDFTRDHETAMKYYERALEVAERNVAPSHSILISMGERYLQEGRRDLAKEYLTAGLKQAFYAEDGEMIARADEALHRLSDN